MSREIKFRVYSNYYKKYFDTSGKGIFCEVHHLALKPDGKLYYADIGIDYPGTLSECPTLEWEEDYDDCVVEQYTGLTDKNGKEIYEGDIVKWLDGLGEYTNFVVEWQENRARFCLRNEYSHYDYEDINDKKRPYIEVIGNIHENPELLEDEDEDEDDTPTNAEINDLTDIGYGG